jgi:hypothetical protein
VADVRKVRAVCCDVMKDQLGKGWLRGLLTRALGVGRVAVRFGLFGTTRPISRDFGWDRDPHRLILCGKLPRLKSSDVRGRVLEIGDDAYSRRYGGSKITRQDVLHLDLKHPKATLLGDLTQPHVLPDEAFDCILLSQTLQLIFDLEKAVGRLHAP